MADGLKKHNITCVSLWPASGAVQTELALNMLDDGEIEFEEMPQDMVRNYETLPPALALKERFEK